MAKPQIVSFISKYTELELVRSPANDVPVPSGIGWVKDTAGVRYKFMPILAEDGTGLVGRLDVKVGQDKLIDQSRWLADDAEHGIERDAPTALMVHREFGHDFKLMDVPAGSFRSDIRRALAALDHEGLEALIAQERAANARAGMLAEAQDALDLVNEQIASLKASQAQVEAETPKAKAKPKATAAA